MKVLEDLLSLLDEEQKLNIIENDDGCEISYAGLIIRGIVAVRGLEDNGNRIDSRISVQLNDDRPSFTYAYELLLQDNHKVYLDSLEYDEEMFKKYKMNDGLDDDSLNA